MLNSHKIFYNSARDDFLAALDISNVERDTLASARELIRSEIREGFRTWQQFQKREVLIETAALKKVPDPTLRPKFRMQGSASYFTLNDPAHHPPQQIDYDDGVYLPVSFLAETGSPVVASSGYFKLVETILEPLCKRKHWDLVKDKSSCVRVVIDAKSHIDLPLYAIPDNEFQQLVEAASMHNVQKRDALRDEIGLDESIYEKIPENEIRLAHRQDGWMKSDPRLIEKWFKAAIAIHGDQLRRICRYLKAWRDYHWKTCSLSSITLMACAVDIYEKLTISLDEKRDDLALNEVSSKLSDYFGSNIANPVIPGIYLNDSWAPASRAEFIKLSHELSDGMFQAIHGSSSAQTTLATLTKLFGERIPQKIELIETTLETKARSYTATKVSQPSVPKTTSG